jgi:KaiC/GvpD/RAD55 family RecA-like ATPase
LRRVSAGSWMFIQFLKGLLLNLIARANKIPATCLITSEAMSVGERRLVQPEEYLSQGVVNLQTLRNGERVVSVLKMRGSDADSVPRPYKIVETGSKSTLSKISIKPRHSALQEGPVARALEKQLKNWILTRFCNKSP